MKRIQAKKRGKELAMAAALLLWSAGAQASWMNLLLPLAQGLSLKIMENSVQQEEARRGIGKFAEGEKMRMIEPEYLLDLDAAVIQAFPSLDAREAVDLKLEIAGWVREQPPEAQAGLLSALKEDLERIRLQRERIGARSPLERVQSASRSGSQCQNLGEEEARRSLALLESKLSPWPEDASRAWSQSCREILGK